MIIIPAGMPTAEAKVEDVEGSSPSTPEPDVEKAVPAKSGGKRKASPKNLTELENGTKEPHAKKSKKMILSEKYREFAEQNSKYLTTEVSFIPDNIFTDYKEFFEDPDVIKSYCLPLFHFVDEYVLHITQVHEFENITVECTAGLEKINELRKLKKDLALPQETLELFEKKYSKKNWKVPKKDYSRIRKLFDECPEGKEVYMQLMGVEISRFKGKNGEQCVSLNPRLRYF